ncbi:unnamed protein product [Eruca vesicaria subsp. sativa]|uniref:Sulfotransferase n=1 Tax=Eruca vesicaria subsp. sativa TaxID=29727 RepID=A0ABC8JTG0_ERUVS|nr:unnamed protein product [Eruca vesicaria subsp. sativa]CAH8334833.1 unnamed protein product [Eruca vesicaria subsp. sativa]
MESERLTTVPNQDETKNGSSEFEKNQERYKALISTLTHEKGWRQKEAYIEYGGKWWTQTLLEGCLRAQEFFQARPNHFLVCSYPKTGTTWLKALTFAIANRARFDHSSSPLLRHNPHELVPYIEFAVSFFPQVDVLKDKGNNTLFSTHIPYELLPESVVRSGCKLVYIWRDPKDTFISMWTFLHKAKTELGPVSNLEESFDMFCRGLSWYGHYLDHVLGYWKSYQENPDKILFLKYELMRAEPLPFVKKLAEFMGFGFTAQEEEKGVAENVVKLCSFETLKNLEANKGEKGREDRAAVYPNSSFFRKGKVGDWSNYLTLEMAARIDGIMEEKFKDTGLLEISI